MKIVNLKWICRENREFTVSSWNREWIQSELTLRRNQSEFTKIGYKRWICEIHGEFKRIRRVDLDLKVNSRNT